MSIKTTKKETKPSEVINLRIEPTQRNLIDLAANISGKSRSAFMLDAAYQKARETLLDRKSFSLDDAQWEAFNQALDSSPTDNEQLSKLLHHKAPWK